LTTSSTGPREPRREPQLFLWRERPTCRRGREQRRHQDCHQHCHTEPDGFTTCFAVEGVVTETVTPSGNTSYTGHMKTAFAAYAAAGALLSTTTGTNHAVRLFKHGGEDVQVLAERFTSTTTLADGSACTSTYTMQYVNGQIRFHTVEHVCN
jgi:hypothetical protein